MGTNCAQEKRKKLSRFFNFTFRYLDEILKLNDSKFDYFVGRICKVRVGSERNFTTKEMIAIFAFGNLLYVCSNIPVAPAYTVYIFQLIRQFRACSSHHDLFVGGFMSYLRCLCLFAFSGGPACVGLCLCFVFLRLMCPVLTVSLDCSVFYNVYFP